MVKMQVRDVASMGQPIQLRSLIIRAWARVRPLLDPRCPYRVGEAVVAEDPFNGRREGIVVSRHGSSLGIRTAAGTFTYDHRQVKYQD